MHVVLLLKDLGHDLRFAFKRFEIWTTKWFEIWPGDLSHFSIKDLKLEHMIWFEICPALEETHCDWADVGLCQVWFKDGHVDYRCADKLAAWCGRRVCSRWHALRCRRIRRLHVPSRRRGLRPADQRMEQSQSCLAITGLIYKTL